MAHDGASARAGRRFPGVISGNTIQVPVHIPVNLCGNTIDIVGLLNPRWATSASTTDPAPPGGRRSIPLRRPPSCQTCPGDRPHLPDAVVVIRPRSSDQRKECS
ncbi:chaplin [Streptomyces sp. M19]